MTGVRDDHRQAALFRSSSSGHPAEEQLLTAEAQLAALDGMPAADQVAAYGELHELLTVALARTAETSAASSGAVGASTGEQSGAQSGAQGGALRAQGLEPSG